MLRCDEFNRFPERIVDEPVEVRLAKAKDLKSTPKLLEVLSRDDFWYVRDYVASNINTPKHCLETLKNDSDFRVRSEAIQTLEKLGLKRFKSPEDLEHKISLAEQTNSKPYTVRTHTYNIR